MLTQLHVRDLAIIDEIDIELQPGLTVLTGETGAGKSILVDALGLVLGDRTDSSVVRHGARRAEIAATFDLRDQDTARAWLQTQEIEAEEECLLRRVVSAEGRSRAYINGVPVALQSLRQFGALLVEIHGQHAHQSLGKPAIQRQILDYLGGHEDLLAAIGNCHREWQQIRADLTASEEERQDREARLDLLRYQLRELEGLEPRADEYRDLEDEHRRLANVDRLAAETRRALEVLYGDDDRAVQSLLGGANQRLAQLNRIDPRIGDLSHLLESAEIQVREAAEGLQRYLADLDVDPNRLSRVEDRIGAYLDLARKHRVTADGLEDRLETLGQELKQVESASERLAELRLALEEAGRRYRDLAEKLSAGRVKVAGKLGREVSAHMQELGMQGGRFAAVVTMREDGDPAPHGLDDVAFEVSANPGQPLQRLSKVASGGELSRIALAIQAVAAAGTTIATMIFDEVDAGIGGGVAEIVGRCLVQLGERRQVLCVTHLAQVASQGHQQFRVAKLTDGQVTRTSITPLTRDERVEELARMLGGVDITATTRKHAREMLQNS